MDILQVTPYYAPAYAFGGVTRSVEGMARALARRGHTVTVLTTDAFSQSERCSEALETRLEGVRVVRVPNLSIWLRGRANLSTPYRMRARAAELLPQADVIHCHEFRTVENLLVTPLAVRLGKPLALSPHGTLSPDTGRSRLKVLWDRILSPAVGGRFDHIIGLTEAEKREIRVRWVGFNQVGNQPTFSVIPNGVDPAEYAKLPGRAAFRERYGLGDAPVCLFMGRLHPRKGVGLLAEAFKQAEAGGARLVIAGPDEGALPALQTQIDPRIILTGYLSGAERLAALAGADLLALPATGEGLPIVVLEAMASGLPVIVSPGCNLPEVAQQGAGIEVEPRLELLAEALRTLLTDAERRGTMGAAARALVQARFTWDGIAAQLEAVYRGMVERPA